MIIGRNITSFAKTKFLYTATNVNLGIWMIYQQSVIDDNLEQINGYITIVTVDTDGVVLNIIPSNIFSQNTGASYDAFLQVILTAVIPNSGGMTIGDVLGKTLTDNSELATNYAVQAGYLAPTP